MSYQIKHKTQPNFLLAICDTQASAEKWRQQFNAAIWMDKTMTVGDLEIVRK